MSSPRLTRLRAAAYRIPTDRPESTAHSVYRRRTADEEDRIRAARGAASRLGVEIVFGLPGDGINGITEGFRRHADRIRFVLVHHEEAAAFMATGYAKTTGPVRRSSMSP
ncbi:MAG: thiamine pyrophosphate-binding protein [Pseudonocardiaceae bacterium]